MPSWTNFGHYCKRIINASFTHQIETFNCNRQFKVLLKAHNITNLYLSFNSSDTNVTYSGADSLSQFICGNSIIPAANALTVK